MSESSLCTFQGPNGVWLSSASLLLDVGGMHVNYPRLWQLRELDNSYLSTSSPVHGCTIREDTGQDDSIMHLVTWLVGMAFTRQHVFKTNKSPASSFGDGNSSWTSKDASAVSRQFGQYYTLRSICAGTSLLYFFKTASDNDFIFDVNVCIFYVYIYFSASFHCISISFSGLLCYSFSVLVDFLFYFEFLLASVSPCAPFLLFSHI